MHTLTKSTINSSQATKQRTHIEEEEKKIETEKITIIISIKTSEHDRRKMLMHDRDHGPEQCAFLSAHHHHKHQQQQQ